MVNGCLLFPWPNVKTSLDALRQFLLVRIVSLKQDIVRGKNKKIKDFNRAASMIVNNYSMTSQLTMETVHTDVIGDVLP
jgi:hypothetical protein